MTFTLSVDAERWRKHLASVVADTPGLVPVAKGNGYGFGLERLGEEAARLGVDAVAVGVPEEVARVRTAYDGSVLVLTPYHDGTADAPDDPRLVRTVSHVESLRALGGRTPRARVVLELRTTLRRHGLAPEVLPEVAGLLGGVDVEGWALHLPLGPGQGTHADQVVDAVALLRGAGIEPGTLWVSHLGPAQLRRLEHDLAPLVLRPRTGTALWLGDRGAARATGTVLDATPLARGERYGYRQRRAPFPGTLVVVSGGTAHGVGLVAPKAVTGLVARAKVAVGGGLEAAGLTLSPFTVAGRRRWFAEPPHMQVSMLLLPADVPAPAIGDELECDVRMTTSTFDRVVLR
ncbi:alanine racemase [Vallicoccus soli]|uniref:Alanine racemase n=1 Tax=Vallicoccus soli TaxID=2339232 RepID=A0A3A3Z1A2_9ACTN|nr:alanine racemase [Vallicoccus soli]RJK94167.1 alanine racemase [Vallicoccus soli]